MFFPQWPDLADDAAETGIFFDCEDIDLSDFDEADSRAWLTEVAIAENAVLQIIYYIFCSDEYLLNINREYLQHDYYTDIITFPYSEPGILHGDLYISTERVADNARTNGVAFGEELARVMVHGLLHLAGYGDKTPEEAAKMREKENFYLTKRKNSA
jgi:probable rRNA maturation factor